MDIHHSFVLPCSHSTSAKVRSVRKAIRERTRTQKVSRIIHLRHPLTSSPTHPLVFVFRHSMNRSAIVQNARIFPFVAWTKPTASIATQLRIVVGSARRDGEMRLRVRGENGTTFDGTVRCRRCDELELWQNEHRQTKNTMIVHHCNLNKEWMN